MAELPLFVDIDGTLTDSPTQGGQVLLARLAELRALIAAGREVVLWTGGGTGYAQAFAELHGLRPSVCVGKPSVAVDNCPTIRPAGRLRIVAPEDFFEGAG